MHTCIHTHRHRHSHAQPCIANRPRQHNAHTCAHALRAKMKRSSVDIKHVSPQNRFPTEHTGGQGPRGLSLPPSWLLPSSPLILTSCLLWAPGTGAQGNGPVAWGFSSVSHYPPAGGALGLRPKDNTLGTAQPRLLGAEKGQLSLFGKPDVWKVLEISVWTPKGPRVRERPPPHSRRQHGHRLSVGSASRPGLSCPQLSCRADNSIAANLPPHL